MKFKLLFLLLILPSITQAKQLTQAEFDLAIAKSGFILSEINKTTALAKQKDNSKAYLVTVCMKFDILENTLNLTRENLHLAEAEQLEKKLSEKLERESKVLATDGYSRQDFCSSVKKLYAKSVVELYKDQSP